MIPLLLAGAVVAFVVWRGWGKAVLSRGQWRLGAALVCIGAFTAAVLLAIRGELGPALAMAVIGVASMFAARSRRGSGAPRSTSNALSIDEARSLLGVGAAATEKEIRAAYTRLMRSVHPDRGGTSGLAAQLNAARDRLLKS